MAIPQQTAKFKYYFAMAIWCPIAEFNSHQYIWLYSIARGIIKIEDKGTTVCESKNVLLIS